MDMPLQDEKPFDLNNLSPEQLKMLIEKMVSGFALHKIVLDHEGKPIDYIFLEVNPAFEEKTGLKKENIIGKKVTDVLPGTLNDPENFIGKYGAVALGGEPLHFEAFSQALGKWFLINAYSPQKYYFVVMMKDISDIKLSEQRFLENDKRLRMLLEILEYDAGNSQEFLDFALSKSITMTDSKIGYIYHYNEDTKLFTLNSWSKEVMQICTVQEAKTVYELDKTGLWGEAVRQRKPIMINDFSKYNPLKKGYPEGHAPLTSFLTVPVFHNDKIVAVVGVGNKEGNYDDNNVLQLELLMDGVWKILKTKEAEDNLKKEQEKFKQYFDKSPQGIFVIDKTASITEINPTLSNYLGYTKEELIGKSLITYLVAEFVEKAQKGLSEVISSNFHQGDYSFLTKEGIRSDMTIKVVKLTDEYFLGFCDDITDKLKTIKSLEESNKELQRLNSVVVNRELKMIQLKQKLTELGVDPSTV